MCIMSLGRLNGVLPVPFRVPGQHDEGQWKAVEQEIGAILPTDYKELVAVYGTGCIDGFLWVFNPFSTNPYLNLVSRAKGSLEGLRTSHADLGEQLPFPVFPEDCGVYPWGVTDNGDELFWRFHNGQLQHPLVIAEARGPEWQEFDLSVTDFLYSLLARIIVVRVFPDDFPADKHAFLSEDEYRKQYCGTQEE
jgi:hypothetical protein